MGITVCTRLITLSLHAHALHIMDCENSLFPGFPVEMNLLNPKYTAC